MKALLYGLELDMLAAELEKHSSLERVEADPDVVICFGGDGTLLSAENRWPGIPKVPIRNSRRGNRCIAQPPDKVLTRLAAGEMERREYTKLAGAVTRHGDSAAMPTITAINELNVHMGRINAAVRFRIWVDNEPFERGEEIIGDGFVISTPFGSTAYFHQITRGLFFCGLGIGLKSPWAKTTHVIVPETSEIVVEITRGPALLAHDNTPEYLELEQGDRLVAKAHAEPAVLLTWVD
jgi:NAD+ kinase